MFIVEVILYTLYNIWCHL